MALFPHRLEHVEAGLSLGVVAALDEALVHQGRQNVQQVFPVQ
jgi:hypothetical protein